MRICLYFILFYCYLYNIYININILKCNKNLKIKFITIYFYIERVPCKYFIYLYIDLIHFNSGSDFESASVIHIASKFFEVYNGTKSIPPQNQKVLSQIRDVGSAYSPWKLHPCNEWIFIPSL